MQSISIPLNEHFSSVQKFEFLLKSLYKSFTMALNTVQKREFPFAQKLQSVFQVSIISADILKPGFVLIWLDSPKTP